MRIKLLKTRKLYTIIKKVLESEMEEEEMRLNKKIQ